MSRLQDKLDEAKSRLIGEGAPRELVEEYLVDMQEYEPVELIIDSDWEDRLGDYTAWIEDKERGNL